MLVLILHHFRHPFVPLWLFISRTLFPFPESPVPPNYLPLILCLNGHFDLREGQHIKPIVLGVVLWMSCLGNVKKKKKRILAPGVGALML